MKYVPHLCGQRALGHDDLQTVLQELRRGQWGRCPRHLQDHQGIRKDICILRAFASISSRFRTTPSLAPLTHPLCSPPLFPSNFRKKRKKKSNLPVQSHPVRISTHAYCVEMIQATRERYLKMKQEMMDKKKKKKK